MTLLLYEEITERSFSGWAMGRFVEGEDRHQGVLLPEYLDEYVSEENPVRVIDVFVDALDLAVVTVDTDGMIVPIAVPRIRSDGRTPPA